MVARSILTKVIVMTLAGYNEWYYSNDKKFLEERGLSKHVAEILEKIYNDYNKLVEEFTNIRRRGIELVKDVKQTIIEILHSHKLPGRCKLY